MKSFLPIAAFLSLLLFAGTIASARKDVGEYWRAVMKDQPMPEALEGLVRIEAAFDEKTKCNTPASIEHKEDKIINVEDFEPRPNLSAYGDDASVSGEKSSSFAEDFEPRPNLSAYGDDISVSGEKSSSFAEDFEPRPNLSAYGGDDAGLKAEKKSFASDFEQEPNISIHRN